MVPPTSWWWASGSSPTSRSPQASGLRRRRRNPRRRTGPDVGSTRLRRRRRGQHDSPTRLRPARARRALRQRQQAGRGDREPCSARRCRGPPDRTGSGPISTARNLQFVGTARLPRPGLPRRPRRRASFTAFYLDGGCGPRRLPLDRATRIVWPRELIGRSIDAGPAGRRERRPVRPDGRRRNW